MARAKKVVLTGTIDKTKAEEAFAEYATADARECGIKAKMDVEMTRIREKYQEKLTELGDEKAAAFEKLQSYAENNREEFGNRKSLEFAHGVLGFRTGTPKLKLLKGFTWNSVTNLIKEFLPDYVRISEEPAKDRLLSDREAPEVSALFKKIGIMVDQDETFYVEPKKELELAN